MIFTISFLFGCLITYLLTHRSQYERQDLIDYIEDLEEMLRIKVPNNNNKEDMYE